MRPIAYDATLGGNVASSGDSTRYGVDLALEYMGAALKGSTSASTGRMRRGPTTADWYAQATFRVLPWVQLVAEQEDFRAFCHQRRC